MNRVCTSCGQELGKTARFCPVCGSPSTGTSPLSAATIFVPGYTVPVKSGHPLQPAPKINQPARTSPPGRTNRIEGRFTVLQEEGPRAILECPRCGLEFPVDAYAGENLFVDPMKNRQLAVCPLCGTVQK